MNGCSLLNYELQPTQPTPSSLTDTILRKDNVTFSISFNENVRAMENKDKYLEIIKAVFEQKNVKYQESEKPSKSKNHLSVEIWYNYVETLPQENLTDYSFGIIPSWGTRYGMYRYRFTLYENGKEMKTVFTGINKTSFKWVLVIPLIWMNNYTNEKPYELFEKSLTNFIFGELKSNNSINLTMYFPRFSGYQNLAKEEVSTCQKAINQSERGVMNMSSKRELFS